MKKLLFLTAFLFINFSLISCANKDLAKKETDIKEDYQFLYISAMEDIKLKKYNQAEEKFKKITINSPLSNEGIQSIVMLGFIDYANLEYLLGIRSSSCCYD